MLEPLSYKIDDIQKFLFETYNVYEIKYGKMLQTFKPQVNSDSLSQVSYLYGLSFV